MSHLFTYADLKPNKWYLVHTKQGARALQYSGKQGEGHFNTRCGFGFWTEASRVESGPYSTVQQADDAWTKPSKRKYGGSRLNK